MSAERESLIERRDFWQDEARSEKIGAVFSRVLAIASGLGGVAGASLVISSEFPVIGSLTAVVGSAGYLGFNKLAAAERSEAVDLELKALVCQTQIDDLI
jgi:hypothetical protein